MKILLSVGDLVIRADETVLPTRGWFLLEPQPHKDYDKQRAWRTLFFCPSEAPCETFIWLDREVSPERFKVFHSEPITDQ